MPIRSAAACYALAVVLVVSIACSSGDFFTQYEYEEEIYLSLDGTATMYVNSSIAALDALRGAAFDPSPEVPVDREAVRAFYATPFTRVTRVSTSRRRNRNFVHIRLDVESIGDLAQAAPFAWSTYRFGRDNAHYEFRQTIGGAAGKQVGDVGWTGRELIAFRMHLPSKIAFHNTDRVRRGNILAWEQPLADRLRGVPITVDVRMETQSILYRTLALFGATFLAVAVTFALVIWWVLRHGARRGTAGDAAA